MRRLYIGGLSHSITQNDLKERFGRFGVVEDVEVRTRMDDEGVPYKTFSYININISDADLKKCMTLLNKSKWKGGTLQIETAKESFLQRLAEERQTAAEQQGLRQPEAEDQKQKVLDSLSKAGVENFTMKAAVPGTEVPGHKDWVVSKFGRVLPVLQLRAQKGSRARTLKYDPSKYSHNIRKLDRAAGADPPAPLTPVTQLTWEVRGGDDDISKKRRGEFPPFEPPRRKKVRAAVNARGAEGGARSKPTADSAPRAEAPRLANGREPATDPGPPRRTWPRFAGGADSDDEIRRLVAAQDTSHGALRQEEDDEGDKLEVVGLDYLVCKAGPDDKDENDYDSADTDELFASRKAAPPPPPQERPTPRAAAGNQGDRKRTAMMKKKKKKKSRGQDEEDDSSEEEVFSRKPPAGRSSQKQSKKMKVLPDVNPPSSESDEVDQEEEEEEEEGPYDCSSDSDYEAMFSNVTRLEISLADLQKLAEESEQTSETTAAGVLAPAHKKGTLPEEILAFLMKDSKEDRRQQQNEEKKKKNKPAPLPAFKGTRAPGGGSDTEDKEGGGSVKKQKLEEEAPQTSHKATGSKISGRDLVESESSEEEEEEEEEAACGGVNNMAEAGSSSSSEEEEEKRRKKPLTAQPKAAASSSSSSSSSEEEQENAVKAAKPPPAPNSESSSKEEEEEEEEEQAPPPRLPLGAKEKEERQRKANERRLAAVQQRQKEAEEHKQLIQGALSSLDAPKAAAGKHIVFGSGDEDERRTTSEDEATGDKAVGDKETAKGKVRPKPSVPQLFGGSEDEEEDDDEEDGSRFDIKPQFEGHVGQKLMELQSRFGRDERFRMDSRFLDEEEEEESEKKKSGTEEEEALDEERKKNLSILQSVLGGSQPAGAAKAAAKAKTFRDVSALHYDPSREEHAAFETKTDDTKTDSKSARRKKREEAQKLPEVSKEIYYDVSGDLKAVFGQAKADEDVVPAAEDKETNWDREEEAEEEEEEGGGGGGSDEEPTLQPSLLAADPAAESEEASGFKFSFFEDDTQKGGGETEYKVESIQAPKVSWQQDLRFPDSSSDDDDEEQQPGEEEEEQQDATAKTTEVEIPSKTQLFFFYSEDSRLAEGPRSFCRPSHLEEQREQWEERRTELRQEYRKKHKDARRKLRSSMKS